MMTTESVLPADEMKTQGGESHEELLANRARHSAHRIIDRAAENAAQIETRLRDKAGNASETMSEQAEKIDEQMKRGYASVRRNMRDHPAITLGVVFVAGALLGKVLSR